MDGDKEYLTKEKFEELTKELDYLKRIKRKEVAEHLEYARSLGDLSENAEYHEAREEQANLEDRILRLENLLKSAKIISSGGGAAAGGQVRIGSSVTVHKEKEKETDTYKIVGFEEADMSAGKISVRSPFGQSILGKKSGDVFSFKTPSGIVKYKIISIN